MEKEALSRECGVAVRSIEYWFWARNKKLRADPDAFSPGGTRNMKIKSPPNPENHWSSWDPKRPREDDDAKKATHIAKATPEEDEWMSEPVSTGNRPAAAPVTAGADSLLSSGSAPQQLQDLLGNAASRFPNVEIPSDSCTEHGQDNAEESPLQISSAGSVTGGGTSWTDGADSMEPGCWGWNEEHANGSDNADGPTAISTSTQLPTCATQRSRSVLVVAVTLKCVLLVLEASVRRIRAEVCACMPVVCSAQIMTAIVRPSSCGYPHRPVAFHQRKAAKHSIDVQTGCRCS